MRRGAWLGADCGEIPAASAGMTDLARAGVTEVWRGCNGGRARGLGRVWRWGGAWCSPRRDTRGKRGYDGGGCAGVTEVGARV